MRNLIVFAVLILSVSFTNAQSDVYSVTSGEMIFGWADVDQTPIGGGEMQGVSAIPRFSVFFHVGQYVHLDLTDAIGLYSGMAVRNIGFITEDDALGLDKEKHRSYTLGIPIALKLGSFRNHFYVFGGAEYEMLFHYKYKYWENGDKYKTSEWFSDRTKRFVPSVFAGVQFPKGLNVKFKYYLDDFLNSDFKKGDDPRNDYSRYGKTQMFHISLCWQFNTKDFKKVFEPESRGYEARL